MLTPQLQALGLKEKEAKTYLKLLELGSQPTSVIARHLHQARTTTQFHLDRLCEKQFINKTTKNRTNYYSAIESEQLQAVLESQKIAFLDEIQTKQNLLKKLKPQLKQIANKNTRLPQVRFFEGLEGVATAYDDFYKDIPKGSTIFNYATIVPAHYKQLRKTLIYYMDYRIKHDIFSKTICAYSEEAIKLKLTDPYSRRKTVLSFDEEHLQFAGEIIIFRDTILTLSFAPDLLFANLTVNQQVGNMYLRVFNLAWKQASLDDTEIMQSTSVKKRLKLWSDLKQFT